MKKLYILLMLVSLFGNANAADGSQDLVTGIPGGGGVGFPHFTPQLGAVPAATHYRLRAKTFTQHNGLEFQPVDSVNYSYNYAGGRGGLIDPDQPNKDESILFDDAITYYYNSGIGSYQNRLFRNQSFDSENRINTLKYSRWDLLNAAWKDSSRYLYSYVTGTKKISTSSFQLYVGGTWSHDITSTLTYNGNNVVDITSLDYNVVYTYDANNNIISIEDKIAATHGSGTLSNNERKTYTYNVNNELQTYTLAKWDDILKTWVNSKYYEYSYTGSNLSASMEYNWNGSSWDKYSYHVYTYTSSGNKTSELLQLWNGNSFVNNTLETRAYNTYGLLESVTTAHWNTTSSYWEYNNSNTQIRYYYEYYSPTNVNIINAKTAGIQVFPNPAINEVSINLNWQKQQETTISIYDNVGVCVYNTTLPASSPTTKTIDLSAFAAGNYTISAIGSLERQSSKLLIIK